MPAPVVSSPRRTNQTYTVRCVGRYQLGPASPIAPHHASPPPLHERREARHDGVCAVRVHRLSVERIYVHDTVLARAGCQEQVRGHRGRTGPRQTLTAAGSCSFPGWGRTRAEAGMAQSQMAKGRQPASGRFNSAVARVHRRHSSHANNRHGQRRSATPSLTPHTCIILRVRRSSLLSHGTPPPGSHPSSPAPSAIGGPAAALEMAGWPTQALGMCRTWPIHSGPECLQPGNMKPGIHPPRRPDRDERACASSRPSATAAPGFGSWLT